MSKDKGKLSLPAKADKPLTMKDHLEAAEAEIAAIEAKSGPLREHLQKEWVKQVEPWNKLKAEKMEEIRQIEGHHERQVQVKKHIVGSDGQVHLVEVTESAPWSRLHELKKMAAQLRSAGAHR